MFTASSSNNIVLITLIAPYSWYEIEDSTSKIVIYTGQSLRLRSGGESPLVDTASIPFSTSSTTGLRVEYISSRVARMTYGQGSLLAPQTTLSTTNIFYHPTTAFSLILIFTFFN